jgi:hypothetical protein
MRDLYVKQSYDGSGWVVWRGDPDAESVYETLNAHAEKWFFTRRSAVKYAKRLLELRKQKAERITLEDFDA